MRWASTNEEHDELFDRLGITKQTSIENSVIAAGSVRDMLSYEWI